MLREACSEVSTTCFPSCEVRPDMTTSKKCLAVFHGTDGTAGLIIDSFDENNVSLGAQFHHRPLLFQVIHCLKRWTMGARLQRLHGATRLVHEKLLVC